MQAQNADSKVYGAHDLFAVLGDVSGGRADPNHILDIAQKIVRQPRGADEIRYVVGIQSPAIIASHEGYARAIGILENCLRPEKPVTGFAFDFL